MIRSIPTLAASIVLGALVSAAVGASATTDLGPSTFKFERANDPPAALRVPDGHRIVFEAIVASGTQTYRCGPDGKYAFLGPTAMLRGHDGQYAAHYFGPSWQYQDGSVVAGKTIAKQLRADSIDELLLQVTQHVGRSGLFSDVDYVQRLATVGGAAPPKCDPTRDAVLAVPYSAIYQFWAPSR